MKDGLGTVSSGYLILDAGCWFWVLVFLFYGSREREKIGYRNRVQGSGKTLRFAEARTLYKEQKRKENWGRRSFYPGAYARPGYALF